MPREASFPALAKPAVPLETLMMSLHVPHLVAVLSKGPASQKTPWAVFARENPSLRQVFSRWAAKRPKGEDEPAKANCGRAPWSQRQPHSLKAKTNAREYAEVPLHPAETLSPPTGNESNVAGPQLP